MKWNNLTQAQWKEQLHDLLKHSDKAVERAIVVIYDGQSDDEKRKGRSLAYNNIGFNRVDTEPLSIMAEQLLSGRHLTSRQLSEARRKVPKYWRQLMNISKAKHGY